MPDAKQAGPKKPFDDRWINRLGGGFDRWPQWLRIVLILWTLLSLPFVLIDELRTNVPQWLGLLMVAPYAVLLFFVALPALVARWFRRLTWPFRFLYGRIRRK